MARWWVVAVGRGTSLTAEVKGPSDSQPTPGFAGVSFQIVGSQSGYPDKSVAQEAAAVYNAGGLLPDDPSKAAVDKAKQTEPAGGGFSSQGIRNRDTQAGGTVAPDIPVPNPLSGLEAVARVVGDLGRALTDGKLWRSVGWILLGIIVFGFGLLLWLRKPVEQAAATAAKAVRF